MAKLNTLNWVLIALLSAAAGLAKVFQSPQEVAFFAGVGIGETGLIFFGVGQVASAVLLFFPLTRRPAAVLAAALLAGSAAMILVSGKLIFGLVSGLPVAMAVLIVFNSGPRQPHAG